ncbi:uncharacterized protein LOC114315155 isoform X1 [Camellia sinensis]|uniref:uncharacterized protein LOC114315155 isoform X1 n=1 Tax=Camellia sinensis TaxID=4442 RepID=UPI0010355BF4|nr:uncharacterized protein LOC114315155 isoform X1 [Camellia sinensis]
MLNAIRLARAQPQSLLSSPIPYHIGRRSCSSSGLKFRQESNKKSDMEQKQNNNPNAKTGDVMSHSFGEGYASRSDEEGFGGTTCEASDAASKIEQDRMIHENHPAYDKSQGSEVAEKEKARHQTTADS